MDFVVGQVTDSEQLKLKPHASDRSKAWVISQGKI